MNLLGLTTVSVHIRSHKLFGSADIQLQGLNHVKTLRQSVTTYEWNLFGALRQTNHQDVIKVFALEC